MAHGNPGKPHQELRWRSGSGRRSAGLSSAGLGSAGLGSAGLGSAGLAALIAVLAGLAALPARAGDPATGRALADKWCTGCHLVGSSAPGSDVGPPFMAVAADPDKSRGRLEAWLATPHTAMPSMPLSRRDIDDLVSYIESLAP